MDNEVNYTIVGGFVLTLIAAIVITIIWLSSGLKVSKYTSYLIYSKESVSGLNIDAQVEYNGVSVGTVKKISIDHRNPHVVKLLIDIETSTPITRGTVATLTTRGITGVVFIALKDTGKDLHPLETQEGEPYPVIPTTPSLFVRLDIALTRMTTNLDNVSKAFKSLLDEHNLDTIKHSLDNLQDITSALSASTSKFTAIINNTELASHEFEPLLNQTKGAVKSLETQTLPSIYQTMDNMNHLMKSLTDISEQLKQNPSMLLRGSTPPALGPGERR